MSAASATTHGAGPGSAAPGTVGRKKKKKSTTTKKKTKQNAKNPPQRPWVCVKNGTEVAKVSWSNGEGHTPGDRGRHRAPCHVEMTLFKLSYDKKIKMNKN